jgi:hypothetical protein
MIDSESSIHHPQRLSESSIRHPPSPQPIGLHPSHSSHKGEPTGGSGGWEGSSGEEARGEAAAARSNEGRTCPAGATDLTVLVSEPLGGWPVEISRVGGALVVRGAVLVWERNHRREGICSGSPSRDAEGGAGRQGGEAAGDEDESGSGSGGSGSGSGSQGIIRRMCSKSRAMEAELGLRITLDRAEEEGEQETRSASARDPYLGREDLPMERGGQWTVGGRGGGQGGGRRFRTGEGAREARRPCVLQITGALAEEWRCMEVTGAHAQVLR